MAAVVEMGEVDDIHSKEDNVTDGIIMNGDIADDEKNDDAVMEVEDVEEKISEEEEDVEEMLLDNSDDIEEIVNDEDEEKDKSTGEVEIEDDVEEILDDQDAESIEEIEEVEEIGDVQEIEDEVEEIEEGEMVQEVLDDKEDDIKEVDEDEKESIADTNSNIDKVNSVGSVDENSREVQEVDDNSDDEIQISKTNYVDPLGAGQKKSTEAGRDIVILDGDSVKENGTATPTKKDGNEKNKDESMVIDLDTPVKTSPKKIDPVAPRRSTRNVNKRSFTSLGNDIDESEESDVEEVLPQDPLAVIAEPLQNEKPVKKSRNSSATIVVKDTKRLVEIASKSSSGNVNKKEPTLVIIDTNSILSGRGPIPIVQKPTISSPYPIMPVALPAQGVYPANMRATITPIPMNTTATKTTISAVNIVPQAPILPSLTDDMFVVEAPSFIVPYVYEKPPVKDLKDFVKNVADEIKKRQEEEDKDDKDSSDDEDSKDELKKKDGDSKMDVDEADDKKDEDKAKRHTYFDSPIGKFFVDIGSTLVQEFVQTDLLKQQKRKRDREGGQNVTTNKTIQALIKSLEYTKENNQPYKMQMKKCEFCSYKTESALAMAFHLETPHMKNFVYRCNFCPYEVRSPHDILFHMEAEHCVRGRLERAPAFHQCPSCPFEDNQKGKLSRHSVACARKFKPERNLEPPIDWEPPAKIPRAPRMKQQSLSTTAAMYQAMAKTSQMQFMKMQHSITQSALNRGRGRPTIAAMPSKQQTVSKSPGYKQATVAGGASVLVPTNYQISGNQLYQVVGGQDMGNRIGGHMGLVPALSSASSTVTIQNATNKTKTVHQPSISITPLPRGVTSTSVSSSPTTPTGVQAPPTGGGIKPGDSNSKNSFVICEICDGYIKDLEQLRNHMQWIHKVKIHPKMIYNRPPLNCQKCQFRFFTDQGLERHLLGSHGLVTSSMQDAANKCKDSGRCPVCGRVYQWKLLNHVARDHNMTLKPAHLSYKCTVCTATFGMYKQFENHVYSAHSVVAKRSMDKKGTPTSTNASNSKSSESLLKPLKINDEITIIPQMPKSNGAGSSKEGSPSTSSNKNASSSKIGDASISRGERLARRKTSLLGDN